MGFGVRNMGYSKFRNQALTEGRGSLYKSVSKKYR